MSAGVTVRKGPEVCLTVAFHTWEEEYAQDPQSLGAKEGSFELYQADTLAANVVSRVGSSDIGLAKLKDGIRFENTFLKFGVPYLAVDQGIYATNALEINGEPQIRDGVCGLMKGMVKWLEW